MGVHRITSEAAKYYAKREKILGIGVSLLGLASEKLDELTKEQFEKLGDLASMLLPHAPGYAGKLIPIIARLFWKLAGVKEKEFKYVELDEIEKYMEELKNELGLQVE
ncbi:hypothetical protein [Archaeoglobus profundus]|uniref:Uncharacterized protein n=1 Tax=Archaeoglobus profundus (strain DSM 5631 / JCM 9629 / NBRC 100127 / Av18) TaxID=572546 RepID=D2RGM7_ARCPA|nr:hypothetical protein [Archaeoglobus profundus]ADB57452.1 hypothetical protein Arcpr_0383 [Archaeoglobus profundus DSM 5631]